PLYIHPIFCCFLSLTRPPPLPTLFPYTTLFRSSSSFGLLVPGVELAQFLPERAGMRIAPGQPHLVARQEMHMQGIVGTPAWRVRSEEHTSELQSRENLVCRLLLEKKKKKRK